jgi:uncharacterized protein involved in exopolysaccharide biosynthesis
LQRQPFIRSDKRRAAGNDSIMSNTPHEAGNWDMGRLAHTGERVVLVMPEAGAEAGNDRNNLADIWQALWQGKWLILAITLAFSAAGVTYALLATQWYRAEVLMLVTNNRSSNSLMSHLGQFGGLASLAGINIGTTNENTEPMAVLKSKEFAQAFIEEQHLIPVLLAHKWDARAGRWKDPNPKKWPDIRDAVRYFDSGVRKVQEDKKTGLVGLSIEWTDPKVAADWANMLVERINDRMRQRALAEAEANVSYLQQELSASNIVNMQQSTGRLLESEMEKLMVARGNKEFAFRIIDHAAVPKWRSLPNRPQVAILAFITGLVVGCLLVFVRAQRRGKPNLES